MKNLYLLSLLVVLFISGCAGICHGPGERKADASKERMHSMRREIISELAGSWTLISFHIQDASGQTAYPFGKDARGRLIFEPDGRMAVQLMNPDRPRYHGAHYIRKVEGDGFGGILWNFMRCWYGTKSIWDWVLMESGGTDVPTIQPDKSGNLINQKSSGIWGQKLIFFHAIPEKF